MNTLLKSKKDSSDWLGRQSNQKRQFINEIKVLENIRFEVETELYLTSMVRKIRFKNTMGHLFVKNENGKRLISNTNVKFFNKNKKKVSGKSLVQFHGGLLPVQMTNRKFK